MVQRGGLLCRRPDRHYRRSRLLLIFVFVVVFFTVVILVPCYLVGRALALFDASDKGFSARWTYFRAKMASRARASSSAVASSSCAAQPADVSADHGDSAAIQRAVRRVNLNIGTFNIGTDQEKLTSKRFHGVFLYNIRRILNKMIAAAELYIVHI